MAHGPPALLHGRGSQTRGADQIADVVNVGNSRLAMFVDGQRALLSYVQPGGAEIEVLNICLSPHGHKHFIAHEHLPILERRHHLSDSIPPDLSNRLPPRSSDRLLAQSFAQTCVRVPHRKTEGGDQPDR